MTREMRSRCAGAATIAVAALLMTGCGHSLNGTYADKDASVQIEFKSGHKANYAAGGSVMEVDYEVSGKEVKVKALPTLFGGTVVGRIADDGCLDFGDRSLGRLCKQTGPLDPSAPVRAAAMKADLRNLVTAEESFFADHVTYSPRLANLSYEVSAGDTITLGTVTRTGWNATAKAGGTTRTCGIYIGGATPPIAGQHEGEPKCQ
jgi:hypothetical protein